MSFIVSEGEDKPRVLAPAGMHVARCFMLIDLGIQPGFMGGDARKKVRIGFELPNEKHVFDEKKGEEPFTISTKYTMSLFDKANLRKDLESWRGRPFTKEEAKAFDISVLVGKPCMLNIVHEPNDSGKTYANIAAITGLPKGTDCPKAINKPILYDHDKPDKAVLNSLPDWIKKEIAKAIKPTEAAQADAPEGDPDVPF